MTCLKRLQKEYADLLENPISNCNVSPSHDNIYNWDGVLFGPNNTPYEDGIFNLKIVFSLDYPFHPPKIFFTTSIYHPNINKDGVICLDILKEEWSPVLTIDKVLLSLSSLLAEPNPDDPLVSEIGNEMKSDLELFNKKARAHTKKYAI